MSRKGRVLVTGAGTIGLHIARQLIEEGREVVLADIAPDRARLEAVVNPAALQVVTLDVSDGKALATLADRYRIDSVIHTAALLTGSAQRAPDRAVAVNVGGAVNVMELARCGAVGRVVLAGSTSIQYPTFDAQSLAPIPDDFMMRVISQGPTSIYATTKLAMELLARNYTLLFQADLTVVRYAAVLGASLRADAGLVARLIGLLLHHGRRGTVAVIDNPLLIWDGIEEFVDPRDCATGTIAALDAPTLDARVYTLTYPVGFGFADVVDAVRTLYRTLRVELRVPIRGGFAGAPRPRTALSDIDAAARELGYRPAYNLCASLEHLAGLIEQEEAKP